MSLFIPTNELNNYTIGRFGSMNREMTFTISESSLSDSLSSKSILLDSMKLNFTARIPITSPGDVLNQDNIMTWFKRLIIEVDGNIVEDIQNLSSCINAKIYTECPRKEYEGELAQGMGTFLWNMQYAFGGIPGASGYYLRNSSAWGLAETLVYVDNGVPNFFNACVPLKWVSGLLKSSQRYDPKMLGSLKLRFVLADTEADVACPFVLDAYPFPTCVQANTYINNAYLRVDTSSLPGDKQIDFIGEFNTSSKYRPTILVSPNQINSQVILAVPSVKRLVEIIGCKCLVRSHGFSTLVDS